jgi:hypothetical protein
VHGFEQLGRFRLSLCLVTARQCAGDAVLDVLVEDVEAEAFERGRSIPRTWPSIRAVG